VKLWTSPFTTSVDNHRTGEAIVPGVDVAGVLISTVKVFITPEVTLAVGTGNLFVVVSNFRTVTQVRIQFAV
jgi:hypothetical protein